MDLFGEIEIEDDGVDGFDIDCAEFEAGGMEDELDFGFDTEQKRYINPGRKQIVSKPVKYRNAQQLARQIDSIGMDDRFFCFLDGNFIFGDFIEAWIIHNGWNVTEMTISTLSLSENNVDSLANLIQHDYVQKLNMIVSDYFYGHERRNLIHYMYEELDINDCFQLAVSRVHTKICLITTECGKKIIIHGSANLRTSKNVEQIMIECDPVLFNFNESWHNEIIERYKTINKTVGAKDLWQRDQKSTENLMQSEKQDQKQQLGNSDNQKQQIDQKKKRQSHSKAW